MDFSDAIKKIESRELRDASLEFFKGGQIDPSVIDAFTKWRFFLVLFNRIINHETGDYIHPPTNNPWFNQPFRTMLILDFIRNIFIERLQEVNKEK